MTALMPDPPRRASAPRRRLLALWSGAAIRVERAPFVAKLVLVCLTTLLAVIGYNAISNVHFNNVGAAEPEPCDPARGDVCSVGRVQSFVGDVSGAEALREALEACSYQKEVRVCVVCCSYRQLQAGRRASGERRRRRAAAAASNLAHQPNTRQHAATSHTTTSTYLLCASTSEVSGAMPSISVGTGP